MSDARRQVVRFAIMGLASTGLYFALLLALQPAIASVTLLTAVCYALSMAANFVAQGMFTFQVKRLSGRQLRRYLMMHGAALLMNSAAMGFLVNSLNLPLILSQIFVTGCITVFTFTVSKTWVYR